MIVFGHCDSLEDMLADKFTGIGEIIMTDIGKLLLVIFDFRTVRLIHHLMILGRGRKTSSTIVEEGGAK